jgi:hypothetical protein
LSRGREQVFINHKFIFEVDMPVETKAQSKHRLEHVEMRQIVNDFPEFWQIQKWILMSEPEKSCSAGGKWRREKYLMRQLYGLLQPDEGEIIIDGNPVVFQLTSRCHQGGHWHDPPAFHAGPHFDSGGERNPGFDIKHEPI